MDREAAVRERVADRERPDEPERPDEFEPLLRVERPEEFDPLLLPLRAALERVPARDRLPEPCARLVDALPRPVDAWRRLDDPELRLDELRLDDELRLRDERCPLERELLRERLRCLLPSPDSESKYSRCLS